MRVIRHPNIVNLQDVFYSEHNLYLVLELAEGGETSHLLFPATPTAQQQRCVLIPPPFPR